MNFSETIFLFILALLVFGPKKLPEIARQVGKALNEFRRASNEFKAQIEAEISQLEADERRKEQAQKILPPAEPAGAIPSPKSSSATDPLPEHPSTPPEVSAPAHNATNA